MMELFLQHLMNGLMVGCIYALTAVAYTMVYGIIEQINFAFGDLFAYGAFLTITLMVGDIKLFGQLVPMPGLPFWIALPFAMIVVGGMGFLIEKGAYLPLRRAPRMAPLITSIAVSVSLQSLAQSIWGAAEIPFAPFSFLDLPPLSLSGVAVSPAQVLVLVASVVMMTSLNFYVRRTRRGRAMRATAQDLTTASLMGIPVDKVISQTFVIGAAMAALAGVLYALSYRFASPLMGALPGLKALVAAVLGGIGNIPGAMLGGIILGITEAIGAAYIPQGSAYRDVITFGILILVLLFRPQGLLGTRLPDRTSERGGLRVMSAAYRIDVWMTQVKAMLLATPMTRYGSGLIFAIVAVGVAFVIPSEYWVRVMASVLIYAALASGLNLVVGFTGLLDLGYIAFYAVGAYLSSILFINVLYETFGVNPNSIWWLFYVNLILGGLAAAVFGVVLGYPTLRLRGDYLAIMTLGLGEIVRTVALNWDGLTNGPMGIRGIPPPELFSYPLDNSSALYLIALILFAFTFFTISRLVQSFLGRAWVAIREDETVAETVGVATSRYKIYAYAIGAFYAGMMGVFFAHFQQFVSPFSFTLWENVLLLCVVVLGGAGTLWGPAIGAAVWLVFVEWAMDFQFVQDHPETRFLALGILLWALMLFRPQGIGVAGRRPLRMS
jgi:branched-chain amino acid transport system permease protein